MNDEQRIAVRFWTWAITAFVIIAFAHDIYYGTLGNTQQFCDFVNNHMVCE